MYNLLRPFSHYSTFFCSIITAWRLVWLALGLELCAAFWSWVHFAWRSLRPCLYSALVFFQFVFSESHLRSPTLGFLLALISGLDFATGPMAQRLFLLLFSALRSIIHGYASCICCIALSPKRPLLSYNNIDTQEHESSTFSLEIFRSFSSWVSLSSA